MFLIKAEFHSIFIYQFYRIIHIPKWGGGGHAKTNNYLNVNYNVNDKIKVSTVVFVYEKFSLHRILDSLQVTHVIRCGACYWLETRKSCETERRRVNRLRSMICETIRQ